MQWNTAYQWSVTVTSSSGASTPVGPVSLTTEVPQPTILSGIGGDSTQAYDPLSGNFTTSATEAAVKVAGPPLQIDRTYNSMDPRTTGAFGAGWSTAVDAAVRSDSDGTGNVTVTATSGQELRFGLNGDGSYAPPYGSSDVLTYDSAHQTWKLLDSTGSEYDFTGVGPTVWPISRIIAPNGLTQAFTPAPGTGQITTITDGASQRTLTLGWTTGSISHVSSVTTQAPSAGTAPLQWNYNYQGDQLISVCSPDGTCTPTCATLDDCTQYQYASGSQYFAGVLDSGPRSYWQLGDAGGGATASDEVDVNLGTTNGIYHSITNDANAAPLTGSSQTAASFNGTSSYVLLPAGQVSDSTDVTIELWFKAASPTTSGVLFSYAANQVTNPTGNHEPALYIGGNGELYGEFWNGSASPIHTTTSVDDGNWHYAVLTASGNSQSMYLDGHQVGVALPGQVDHLGMLVDTLGAGYWASWPSNTQGGTTTTVGYFSGDIAQVAVYPHPLGSAAVTEHYALASASTAEMTQVTLPSIDAAPTGISYQSATYEPGTGRLATYTDPNGSTWTLSDPVPSGAKAASDALSQVVDTVTVDGPDGRSNTYGYDMLNGGRLVSSSINADTRSYAYDTAGHLARKFDADGNETCLTNDAHGNVLARTWYPGGAPDTPGDGTQATPTCTGSTSSSVNCASALTPCTTFYTYTTYDTAHPLSLDNNKLLTSSDGRSASSGDTTYRTVYTYNTAGQVTSVTTPATSDFPSGRQTSYTYSVGSETAYENNTKTIPAGLLLSKTTLGGATTSYRYYSNGDLAQVTEPSNRYTVDTYDLLGRISKSNVHADGQARETDYSFNAMGKPLTVTYPAVSSPAMGSQVPAVTHTRQDTYSYDTDGGLLRLTQADLTGGDAQRVTQDTYDAQGRLATQTLPSGATASYSYDDFGDVSNRTDANGYQHQYTYNEYGKPTQQILYTSNTSQANPTANCSAPAFPDSDGIGCDLVLDSRAYTAAGLLASETDAMGRTTTYGYDGNQELIAVSQVDPCTTGTRTTNPADPTCTTLGVSAGRQATYAYDGAGNKVSQTVSPVTGGTVGVGATTGYTYDAASRLVRELIDPTPSGTTTSGYANRAVSFTYDAANHVASQTVGSAATGGTSVTSYTYDAQGDRLRQNVTDGSSTLTTTWTYGQNGQPLTMVTPDGNAPGGTPANYTTQYGYDNGGDLTTVTSPPTLVQSYANQAGSTAQPVATYAYDTFGDKTAAADPDLNVTTYAYANEDGQVTSVTQPSYTQPGTGTTIIPTTTYAYDGDGNVVSVTDPRGDTASASYNALGEVTAVTLPGDPSTCPGVAPVSWTYTYDADGEQLSATDPACGITSQTYDYFANRATTTNALVKTRNYSYDFLGDQVSAVTPDGVVTTSGYDHLGELASVTDGAGNTSSFEYGYAGQPTYAFSPDGGFTQYGYDQAGNLTSQADYPPAGQGQAAVALRSESFGYDAAGNVTSAKDWDGNTSTFSYNAAGELTSQVVPVSATASATTSYGYDAAWNQTAITGGNGNTTWTTYNPLNLPESVIKPAATSGQAASARTWTTSYDAAGNQVAVSQPGGVTLSYGYDAMGDLTSQSGVGASAATAAQELTYDPDGRLASATAPGGTDAFTYDAAGNLKQASGPSGTSSVTYTGDGLVQSLTSPGGTTSYAYDGAGRLATLADPLTGATLTYAYNKDSQPASIGYSIGGASGPVQSFGYDGLQRLTSDTVTSASGATLAAQSYGYDPAGNMTSQSAGGQLGSSSAAYAYDKAGRLASSAIGGTTAQYAYDGDGNLTLSGGTTYAYNGQDQVTSSAASAGTTSYAYTLNGALASVTAPNGAVQSYTTDAYGQAATAPGGVGYGYDALGRLVTRTVGSSTTQMSYLGASGTLASDGSRDYTWDPSGQMTATQVPGGTGYTVMNDAHGDLTATFSPTATAAGLAGHAAYAPYGTPSATGYRPDIGFQADYADPSTGQVMMGARWYNPGTGSFTASDVIDGMPLPATVDGNPYAYTSGDPLTEADPTGHFGGPIGNLEQILSKGGTRGGLRLGLGVALSYAPEAATVLGFAALYTVGSWVLAPGADDNGTCAITCYADYSYSRTDAWGSPGSESSADTGESTQAGNSPYPYGSPGFYFPPPPPPPPPPRDCFAAGLCGAKAPSEGAAHAPTVTHKVTTATGYTQACNATGYCYTVASTGNGNGADGLTPVQTAGPTSGGVTVGQDDATPQPAAAGAGVGGGKGGSCGPGRTAKGTLREGDVGSYKQLKDRGAPRDDLTPHHVPQAALGLTPYDEGAAIALYTASHRLTRTYGTKGIATKAEDAGLPLQEALDKDYADLRSLNLPFDVEAGIAQIQQYYETNFPNLLGGGC
jgi:RHS repeat-associated protein